MPIKVKLKAKKATAVKDENTVAAEGLLQKLKASRDAISAFQDKHTEALTRYAELRAEEESLIRRVKTLVKARGNGDRLKPFAVYEAHGQCVVAAPRRELDLAALIKAVPKVESVGKIKKTMTLADAEHLRAVGVVTEEELASCISCTNASVKITYASTSTDD